MVKVGAERPAAAPPHASNTTFVHFILKLSPGRGPQLKYWAGASLLSGGKLHQKRWKLIVTGQHHQQQHPAVEFLNLIFIGTQYLEQEALMQSTYWQIEILKIYIVSALKFGHLSISGLANLHGQVVWLATINKTTHQ